MKQSVLFGVGLSLFTSALAACPIIFDGRISNSAVAADFDRSTSKYDDEYVRGQSTYFIQFILLFAGSEFANLDQTWAEILQFPSVPGSLVRRLFHQGVTLT